jgi:hypothetical protein
VEPEIHGRWKVLAKNAGVHKGRELWLVECLCGATRGLRLTCTIVSGRSQGCVSCSNQSPQAAEWRYRELVALVEKHGSQKAVVALLGSTKSAISAMIRRGQRRNLTTQARLP